MTEDEQYLQDIRKMGRRIRTISPPDIADRFLNHSELKKEDFKPCNPDYQGKVSAVDGSNAFVFEGGCITIAAIRASSCTYYEGGACVEKRRTPLRLVTCGPEPENSDFEELYRSTFGNTPHQSLKNDDPDRAAAVLRDTLEYMAILETLDSLNAGDLLLIDGALRVSHASHDPVLSEIIETCKNKGIGLAAVTKRTTITWGEEGHLLVPAVYGLARSYEVAEPWYIRIPEHMILSNKWESKKWQHGDIYVARLHQRADRTFKIELPEGTNEEDTARIFSSLAAYADDGRVTGYPYPLFDAHRTTKIQEDAILKIKHDIMHDMDSKNMNYRDFEEIFGDYHDTFDRY